MRLRSRAGALRPSLSALCKCLFVLLACSSQQILHSANLGQVGAATPSQLGHTKHQNQKDAAHAASPETAPQNATGQTDSGVDDILNDTIKLLDSLDQQLTVATNHTKAPLLPQAKLRALKPQSSSSGGISGQNFARQHFALDEAEHELTSLAEGFSSERRTPSSAAVAVAPTNHDSPQPSPADLTAAPGTLSAQTLIISDQQDGGEQAAPPSSTNNRGQRQLASGANGDRGELLLMGAMSASGHQQGARFENDFTERHVRFSLDLMRAVFASQGYTAQSSSIDSFLISPVSLQLVLMMMHLGARGATKRELSHALHLLSTSPVIPPAATSASGSHSDSELSKQQQQQQQQQQRVSNSGGNSTHQGTTSGGRNAKLTRRHQQQQQQAAAKPAQAQSSSRQAQVSSANQVQQQNNMHEQFGSALRQLLKDQSIAKALTSANQIFLQRDLPLAQQYEWAVKHYYGADLRQVDFQSQGASTADQQQQQQQQQPLKKASSNSSASNVTAAVGAGSVQQMINEWVERQTRGKISNFLTSPVPPSTLLMALNVLFFKGDWQYKFDPQDTDSDAWFTQANGRTVKLPMMVNKLPLAHAHDPAMKTSIIELPYKAQRLGLFILLPDELNGIFDTMQMLNSSSFANLISLMRKVPSSSASSANGGGGGGGDPAGGINVRIPKFSIESSPRISQILSQQLGLKTLFSPDQADLSGMFASGNGTAHKQGAGNSTEQRQQQARAATPLQVGLDELLHKAVLQVHEQGSVAAAASATIVERVGLFNGQYFEADHPFLLFLMDKQTGLVLFSGVFAGPSSSGQGEAPVPPAHAASASQKQSQHAAGSDISSAASNNSSNHVTAARNSKPSGGSN